MEEAVAGVEPEEPGTTTAGFLQPETPWFQPQGVRIEPVMTDNGSCYPAKVVHRGVRELGTRHLTTRPYASRTNGKAEHFIRTAKELWAYARPYGHSN